LWPSSVHALQLSTVGTEQTLVTRKYAAQQLLRGAAIERLRNEVRRSRAWRAMFRGFRPESLTRAIVIRYGHAFARDPALLTDLCRIFLDSRGAPQEGNLLDRFSAACKQADMPEEIRSVCATLSEQNVLDLPIGTGADEQPGIPNNMVDMDSVAAPQRAPPTADEEVGGDDTRLEPTLSFLTSVVPLAWSPPDDQVTQANQAVTLFERSLMAFIQRQLEALHGGAWLKKGCGGWRNRWKTKADEHAAKESPRSDLLAPTTLFGYAELPELREIVVRRENWIVFEPYFDDKDWFTTKFQSILPLRVGGAHAGQREVFLVEVSDALAAMVDISSRYHLETAVHIDDLFRQTLASGAGEAEVAESKIASNLSDFSDPHVIGREAELRKIQEFWDDEYSRVVSIVGAGGVGKTALLEEFTYQLLMKPLQRDKRPDPEAIVYLTAKDNYLAYMKHAPKSMQFRTLRRIYEATLETVGGQKDFDEELAGLRRQVLSLAQSTRILFALDNLESLDEAEYSEVGTFLDEVPPPSKVMLTTRIQRRFGSTIALKGLPAPDAREFLLTRLAAWGIDISEEDSTCIDDLVSYTDGVPLALVHCANAIHNGRTIEETLDAIKGREFLELLQFSFESSLAELKADGLRVLLFLALSKHPRTRRDVLQVASDEQELDDILGVLREMGFIRPSWEQKKQMRFSVDNPLLRDYVRKRSPEVLGPERYAFVLRKAEVLPADAESPSVTIEIQRALAKAQSLGWREAIDVLEAARATWGRDPDLLAQLGYCYYRTENRAAARPLLEEAIAKGLESATTYFHLALVLYYDGDASAALRYVKTALTLRNPYPLADALAGQCLVAKITAGSFLLDTGAKRGLLEEAAQHFKQSLIAEERGLRDEAHNRRSHDSIDWIVRQLAQVDTEQAANERIH
jgi:tetratricopeptide (TPR) repeat protein